MKTRDGHSIHTIFILLLFCVFAASVLMTLMLGARAYRAVNASADDVHTACTGLSYLTEKVRHGEGGGSVEVGEFSGLPALLIREELDGVSYVTSLYVYDGWLYELFAEQDLGLKPEDGNPILEAEAVDFEEVRAGLLLIRLRESDGCWNEMYVSLRSGGGAAL